MSSKNIENDAIDHRSESVNNLQIINLPNEKDCVEEIINLHDQITNHLTSALQKATRIGELLTIQKRKLGHGKFTPWIKENLPFTSRTAQNYRNIYRHREKLKSENVSCLSQAYNILKIPRIQFKETGDEDEKRYFITISVYEEHKELFKDVLDIAKQQLNTESNSIAIMYIMYDWGSYAVDHPIQG